MLIIRGNLISIAVIDTRKKIGEEGQYLTYSGKENDLAQHILAARINKKEIRYYYRDLKTKNGEIISAKIIITEHPPNHVQPFHTHDNVYEMTKVDKGELVAVENDVLQEDDLAGIKGKGELLKEGDMVINDPGARHTLTNVSPTYTITTTVQAARIPLENFSADWKR